MYAPAVPKSAQPQETLDSARAAQRRSQAGLTTQALGHALNKSAQVQSQIQLQSVLNQSPRASVQAKFVQLMSSAPTPFGRKLNGQGVSDEEELVQYKTAAQLQFKESGEDESTQMRVAQRNQLTDDELTQMKAAAAQREAADEDELTQKKAGIAQREVTDEDELMQRKVMTGQRNAVEEDELVQMKVATVQRQTIDEDELTQTMPIQRQANATGMPDQLKTGIESLSGMSMDSVRVHYNSPKPASLQAHAYAQGSDIHLAPGQEQHLPHEAWHVVQQAQGRVQPTMQMQGTAINDDRGLESEADVMGAKAVQLRRTTPPVSMGAPRAEELAQRVVLPLDDVDALRRRNANPSQQALASAATISTAVEHRTASTNEAVARPWDTRFRPFKWGPLDEIGNEEIRIFGHGATARGSDIAQLVGGYSASQLVALLKELGLRSTYAGLIYLSGCKTAAGDDFGYLGVFYNLIKAYAPAVKVKGNLGNAITLPNGKQAIFRSSHDRDQYLALRATLRELTNDLNLQTQAFSQTAAPANVSEQNAKRQFAAKLRVKQREIADVQNELLAIFYATEDQGTMTVELPGGELPAFERSASAVFGTPTVNFDQISNAPISELLVQTEALYSNSVSFSRPGGKKAVQKRARTDGVGAPLQRSAMLSVLQRVVVTVRDDGADDQSEDMQHNTTQNLRAARNEPVVDTLLNLGNAPLEKLGGGETLYVVGHGTGATISGKSPEDLLTHLESFGLTNNYKGLIDLTSCDSADYVAGFAEALKDKGYVNDVKGYGGLLHVNAEGGFEVLPSRSAATFLDLQKRAKAAYLKEEGELKAQLAGADSDAATRAKLGRLDRNYKDIIAKLNAMFEPAAKHETFSSHDAWKRHGTPTSIEEAVEIGRL